MATIKAVLLAGLCCASMILASCSDGSGDDATGVADVTTTTAANPSTPGTSGSSTTDQQAAPTTSTTTEAAPDPTGGDTAEHALRQFIEAKGLGQTGRAWDLVLPAQRALLDRNAYFDCQDPASFDVVGVEVVDEYSERIEVAGLGEQDSTALTLKLTLSMSGEELTDTDTYHALTEGGSWYVSVDDENFECAKA